MSQYFSDDSYKFLRNLDRQEQNQRWQPYALQLANCRLLPSISPDELMQGFDDE